MAPSVDVRLARDGIVEIDAPRDAAHDGARVPRVLEAERMAQLVRDDLVEERLRGRLAARRRLEDDDTDGQDDEAVRPDLELGLAHLPR